MAKTISTRVPAEWDSEAAAMWLKGQRAEAITRATNAAQAAKWQSPALSLQAAYYLFLLNDFASGAHLLERQAQVTPHEFEVLLNLAVMYSRQGQWAAAEGVYARAIKLDTTRYELYDGLANCLWRLGRFEEAVAAGTHSLEAKDALTRGVQGIALPSMRPAQFATGKTNVISYSLWGNAPRYLRGMLRNVLLAPDIYAGWTVRIHLDATVPEDFVALVERLGAQVVRHERGATMREKLAWRFAVANDQSVGRFLVRDADSVIGVREAVAVQAWIESDHWFHAMRDFWTHTDLMLAGMWGGVAGVLPDIAQELAAYKSTSVETPNIDQWFLRDRIWPHVRGSCMVHDRLYRPPGALAFPGTLPEGHRHVGQNEYDVRREEQERLLAAWIAQCPSLGKAQAFT